MRKWKRFSALSLNSIRNRRIHQNFLHNSRIPIHGQIDCGQAVTPAGQYRLSRSPFAHVGCEVIAAYNLLYSIGRAVPLAQLAAEFERNAMILPFGVWGCNPLRMGAMFQAHGVPVKRCTRFSECEAAFHAGHSMVFSYHIGKSRCSGIHTVFIGASGGEMYVYNRYNQAKQRLKLHSLSELAKQPHLMIVSYILL